MPGLFRLWVVAAASLGVALAMPHAEPPVRPGGALAVSDTLAPLPERLSETGLFVAGSTEVRQEHLAYSPQYPLWSDGATKRRWLSLPPATAIDGSRPDEWQFPPGTRLWKEFSHGRPVETRYIERLGDGSWRYATYVWNADGTDATLAPAEGIAALPVAGAPGGRYPIPSREDCLACHEGANVPVLGVSALQLSPDRDPLAPHSEPVRPEHVDLRGLIERGWLTKFPAELLGEPPRIAASSPTARSALGYLHANCGHCHNDAGPLVALELVLAQQIGAGPEKILETLIGQPSEFRAHGVDTRIVPGRPETSMLALRMRSRNPIAQMPPLATQITDAEALALIERWIQDDLRNSEELMQ